MTRKPFHTQQPLFIQLQPIIKMKKLFLNFIIFVILINFSSSKISAQEEENKSALSVGPALLEQILTPGAETQTKVLVSNLTTMPLPIKSQVSGFLSKEEFPVDKKYVFDASSWIYIEPTDFILQPNEQKEILITIKTPEEAAPGGHYATIYFEPLIPVVALSPQTTYSLARVGVLTFLVVRGEIIEKGSLGAVKIKNFYQSGPIKMEIALKNEGNVHLLPTGKISITDWRGKQVASLTSSPALVLPDTTRDLVFNWDKKYPIGKFRFEGELIFGNDQQKKSFGSFSFWVIPILPLLIPFLLLTAFFIIVILIRRRLLLALKILFMKNINKEILKRKEVR